MAVGPPNREQLAALTRRTVIDFDDPDWHVKTDIRGADEGPLPGGRWR